MARYSIGGRSFQLSPRARSNGEVVFRLRWRSSQGEHEKTFKTEGSAKSHARDIAKKTPLGSIYLQGQEALEYQAMKDLLPTGANALEIFKLGVEQWDLKEKLASVGSLWVSDAIALYIDDAERTPEFKKVLRLYLGKFADAFQMSVKNVNQSDIQPWITKLDSSPKTKYQMSGYLKGFFRWCQRGGAYPPGELEWRIKKPVNQEITFYTVQEAQEMLGRWPKEHLAGIVIQMFAGLRTAEVERLEWKQVRKDGIIILAANSKTKRRRVAPMLPTLQAWLKYLGWNGSGKVANCGKSSLADYYSKVATRIGFDWKRNALRHSFCSYRLAVTKNAAATAYEAGHSEAKQRENYDAVVSEAEGKKWFAIMPG